MRITTHGNDLLVTDQSVGFGALLAAVGVLLVTTAIAGTFSGGPLAISTFLYLLVGGGAIKLGLDRLVATQLIVDPDDKLVITKRWSFMGANVQRIPFSAVQGFTIEPEGKDKRTVLMIQTTRGPVPGAGGARGVRAAWEEVVTAIEVHMGRRVAKPDTTE